RFREVVVNSVALSLRADGSVDRMQIDNVHVMAKIVTREGDVNTCFLGFQEPDSRGAQGYYDAIKSATSFSSEWPVVLSKLSSVVTDGASIKTGEKKGFWALLEKDKTGKAGPDHALIKIWCAVHRSALVW